MSINIPKTAKNSLNKVKEQCMPQDDEQIWLEERGNEWKARSEVKGNKEIGVNDRIFFIFFFLSSFFKLRYGEEDVCHSCVGDGSGA